MAVDLALAKAHCRVTDTDHDTVLTQYVAASQAWVENYTGKMLAASAVVQTETCFGSFIELQKGPVLSLTTIAYVDADGADQTVTGARLRENRIYAPEAGWPAIEDYSEITVTYQAGYATVPDDLESAQLLLVGQWFAYREAVGDTIGELPFAVEALCRPYRGLGL